MRQENILVQAIISSTRILSSILYAITEL